MNELDQSHLTWRKSSRSGGQQECVELASFDEQILIRDSKQHGKGKVLRFTAAEVRMLVQAVKGGALKDGF